MMNPSAPEQMRPQVSAIVCTHNPRPALFAEALASLRAQTLPYDRWELLVIDNASEPPVSASWDVSWHPRGRIIREPELGLTKARLCGFREAAAELFVLVDDDNVLAPDYLETALALSAEWPVLGAWGGQCVPRFESIPPDWTRPLWPLLGIREFDEDRWSNVLSEGQPLPIGAGMCVRRAVAERYVEHLAHNPKRASLDRAANRLMSCGDTDLAFTAIDLDLGCGLFTSLRLEHLMPAWRFEEDYLRDLVHGINYSAVILASYREMQPSVISRSQRVLKWYEALHLDRWQRDFDRIVRRAREAALRDLAQFHPVEKSIAK